MRSGIRPLCCCLYAEETHAASHMAVMPCQSNNVMASTCACQRLAKRRRHTAGGLYKRFAKLALMSTTAPATREGWQCRAMQIGISAHQKLEKLSAIVETMGYQSIPVFGDCFDEVTFLDPVLYPEAMKQFAGSVRRFQMQPHSCYLHFIARCMHVQQHM